MRNILVMKLRHHGDVLLTTALFKALREQFPNAAVDVLIYEETRPLLQNNPHIRQVFSVNRTLKGFKRLKAEWQLIKQVRQQQYDAVIHLTDQWIGALIAALSKAPIRIETIYAKRDTSLWHTCFTHRITPPPRGQAHAVELNLMCLDALGVPPNTIQGELVLVPQEEQLKNAHTLLKQAHINGPFVLIHPAARWPFKCWNDESFAQVVTHIRQQGFHVVLTCSPDPVELAMTQHIESLAKASPPNQAPLPRLVNWGGQMSLPLLTALLSLTRLYVGVDSAPMHMAAALNVPQVALFGPSWLNEWRPWSHNATVIDAGNYGPLPHPDSINTNDPTRLLQAIPVHVVIQAIQDRLQTPPFLGGKNPK